MSKSLPVYWIISNFLGELMEHISKSKEHGVTTIEPSISSVLLDTLCYQNTVTKIPLPVFFEKK